MSIKTIFDNQITDTIKEWGRDITIIYLSSATCNSCGYDPINKSATNSACDTCGGMYYYQVENTATCVGVLKTFVGNLKHSDYSNMTYGFIPEHEARITCILKDVLIDSSSATGQSYLDVDKNIRIVAHNKRYEVKGTYRTGGNTLSIIIATLREIK